MLMVVFIVALLSTVVMGMLQINTEEIQLMQNHIYAAEALATAGGRERKEAQDNASCDGALHRETSECGCLWGSPCRAGNRACTSGSRKTKQPASSGHESARLSIRRASYVAPARPVAHVPGNAIDTNVHVSVARCRATTLGLRCSTRLRGLTYS